MYLGPPLEVPFASSTTTSCAPEPMGVVAVISTSEATLTLVASLPILTVAPETKPVPLMVTGVPPLAGPELGSMDVTVTGPAASAEDGKHASITAASGTRDRYFLTAIPPGLTLWVAAVPDFPD